MKNQILQIMSSGSSHNLWEEYKRGNQIIMMYDAIQKQAYIGMEYAGSV